MARTVKGPLAPAWQETPQSSSEAAGQPVGQPVRQSPRQAHALAHPHNAEAPPSPPEPDGWPEVIIALRLTPAESRVLVRIWQGDKHEAIATALGRTKHLVDKHWRSIQAKTGTAGKVLMVRRIDGILAEIQQAEAIAKAVAEAVKVATEPLQREIAGLQQQVKDLTVRVVNSESALER